MFNFHPEDVKTFKHDNTIVFDDDVAGNSAQVGKAVTLTGEAAETVSLVGDGERITGKLLKVEGDGFCVVQTKGYMTLPGGDSATLTVGSAIVGDLGAASAEGFIQTSAAGTAALAQAARGEIIDASDTANVVVHLY